jgi:hypothetical protein
MGGGRQNRLSSVTQASDSPFVSGAADVVGAGVEAFGASSESVGREMDRGSFSVGLARRDGDAALECPAGGEMASDSVVR